MSERAIVRRLSGGSDTLLAEALAQRSAVFGALSPVIGAPIHIALEVEAEETVVARAAEGVPKGAAFAEALAARLRRAGVAVDWRPSPPQTSLDLRRLAWERGRSSVDVMRADPSLVSEMEIGSWFAARWRARLLRRFAHRSPRFAARMGRTTPLGLAAAADAAFWAGVRSRATPKEWTRLTGSSYVLLLYHRFGGDGDPKQEAIDVDPRQFARQIAALRLLDFHHLSPEELLAFHSDPNATLARRSFAITVDDAFRDSNRPLAKIATRRPQLFVPTSEIGGRAFWAGGEEIMTWDEVRAIARLGVAVGPHARHHQPLTGLESTVLVEEVAGSRADLASAVPGGIPIFAYPHGRYDERVRSATVDAGYAAAYSTGKGRNGAGTDVYGLRRVSVHASDSLVGVLWKALTGESPPRLLELRWRRKGARRR
jgi:peptidoglycan/xylan/chitin deacetylase (PgdA/CDA1 family)